MQRVLDIDLDFFVQPVVHNASASGARADSTRHEVALDYDTELNSVNLASAGEAEAAMAYLRERVGMDRPRPGAAVEHHREVFDRWQQQISCGQLRPPFHVTHLDAHGDFGMGQTSHQRVLDDVLRLPNDERPAHSRALRNDGDFLAYAVACGWIGALDYVYCPGGGSDIPRCYFEAFAFPARRDDGATGTMRLVALNEAQLDRLFRLDQPPPVTYTEPPVTLQEIPQASYRERQPFDLIYLSRSPAFTPIEADELYAAVRATFII